ncbi:DUF6768 family protein [Pseudidiomarina sp.]|uniref:DUF6768 family protein n=1 Tax=Pseudidiomarina sp. TaxID=2081707 RepID=UPI003A9696EA
MKSNKISLTEYLKGGFASGLGWLLAVGYVLAFVFAAVLIYCGYKFFTVTADQQLFWGVCFIVSLIVQVATKLWIFMQTNHNHVMHEIQQLKKNVKK